MPWAVHKEHPETFEVSGNAGSRFHVSKANLRPHVVQKFRELCKGGSVKKMADGGQTEEDTERPQGEPKEGDGEIAEGAPPDITVVIDGTAPEEKKPNDGKVESMRTVREEPPHFIIGGPNGELRVHADNLSAGGIARLRKLAQGGEAQPGYQDPRAAGNEKVAVQTTGDQVNVRPGTVQENPAATRRALMNVKRPGAPQNFDVGGPAGAQPGTPVETNPQAPTDEDSNPWFPDYAGPNDPSLTSGVGNVLESLNPNPSREAAKRVAASAAPIGADLPIRSAAPTTPQAAPGQQTGLDMLPQLPDLGGGWSELERALAEEQRTGTTAAGAMAKAHADKAAALSDFYAQKTVALRALDEKTQAQLDVENEKIQQQAEDQAKKKINPEQYWENENGTQNVWKRVSAGLGMLLGGIGSGLTGQPNVAAQFVQRSIDRNMEAQRANVEQGNNALAWAFRRYGNLKDAALFTRSNLLTSMGVEAEEIGNRFGTPEAMAQGQLLKSQLMEQALSTRAQIVQGKRQEALMKYQLEWQRALMRAFGGQGSVGSGYIPSSAAPPMLAEPSPEGVAKMRADHSGRVIPLTGGAYTFANTPDEAKDIRKALGHLDNLEGQVKSLASTAENNPLALHVPFTDARAAYQQKVSALNTEVGGLHDLHRMSDIDLGQFQQQTPTEKEWISGQGKVKANGMLELIQRKRQEEFQRMGLRTVPVNFRPLGAN